MSLLHLQYLLSRRPPPPLLYCLGGQGEPSHPRQGDPTSQFLESKQCGRTPAVAPQLVFSSTFLCAAVGGGLGWVVWFSQAALLGSSPLPDCLCFAPGICLAEGPRDRPPSASGVQNRLESLPP